MVPQSILKRRTGSASLDLALDDCLNDNSNLSAFIQPLEMDYKIFKIAFLGPRGVCVCMVSLTFGHHF